MVGVWLCYRLSIVESIPVNMTALHVKHISTYESWMTLLQEANTSIDIASYYWILNSTISIADGSNAQVIFIE
jgi:phospholipase D3/4